MFIEILFKILLFKAGVLIYAEHCILKIAEDLGQILVVLHTLLVIIEMPPLLNKQSVSNRTGWI